MTYYYTILTSQFKPVLQTFNGLKLRKVHLLRFYYLHLLLTIVVRCIFKVYGKEIFNIMLLHFRAFKGSKLTSYLLHNL